MKSNHAVHKGYVAENKTQYSTNPQDLKNEYIFIAETSSAHILNYNVSATIIMSMMAILRVTMQYNSEYDTNMWNC